MLFQPTIEDWWFGLEDNIGHCRRAAYRIASYATDPFEHIRLQQPGGAEVYWRQVKRFVEDLKAEAVDKNGANLR
jgi:hypothetical protein